MFGKSKIDVKKISDIQPTSLMDLKKICLEYADGDLDLTKQLYDFLSDGIEGLPPFDPKPPTVMDKIKGILGEGTAWYKENQEDIAKVISVIQAMRGKGAPLADVPMGDIPPTPTPPLDPIN